VQSIGSNVSCYLKQETIARRAGVHHDTALNAIKLFVEMGLLKKIYRGANRTCLYSLGSRLCEPQFVFGLRYSLKNAYWALRSCVARAKKMLGSVVGGLVHVFTKNTARLSKDKKKYLNTYKNSNFEVKNKMEVKEEVYQPPSQEDTLKYKRLMKPGEDKREQDHLYFLSLVPAY